MLVGIIGNTTKAETVGAVRGLAGILNDRSIPFLLEKELCGTFGELAALGRVAGIDELRGEASVVIAFGGDGTMLAAGRALAGSNVPLLGVNLGKLGFLAEFSLENLAQTVDDYVAGRCRIVERTLVEATFPDNEDLAPLLGLNDIVIDKRDGSLMLQLATRIDGAYLGTYNSDGLIIATPTGSTAYSLAVGGPVVAPEARVVVIAPIAPHMLTARPVVVSDDATIEVRASAHRYEAKVRVLADGQDVRNVPLGARIVVRRHGHVAYLVKSVSTTYFDVLRAKLLWGIEPTLNVKHNGFDR